MAEAQLSKAPAIRLEGITKRFGNVVANDNIDLCVEHGQILSVLGENGSGKTTLMNMISGIYFPDHGHIYVDGKEVVIRSPKDAFRYGIGMIHQHFKLVDVFTAAENIVLGLDKKGRYDMKQCAQRVQSSTDFRSILIARSMRCPYLKSRLLRSSRCFIAAQIF